MEENAFDLELDKIEEQAEKEAKIKNRYKDLSDKVKETALAKEEAERLAKEAQEKAQSLEKERDFFKDFSTHATKYPQASEYQEQIWEKVKGGYTTEDATLAILAKEGKLGGTVQPIVQDNIMGGSSSNQITDEKKKEFDSMTSEEKLAALYEAEKRGDITM